MYRIGDFSRITKLTVKALRYYDEENILSPSSRDSETGYRYYDEQDFRKAQLVVLLRDLEFSISEMKEVLAGCDGPEDLSCYLEEKKGMIERSIRREKELIGKINLYTESRPMEVIRINYTIDIREIPSMLVASTRYKGKYGDVGPYFGKVFKAVGGHAAGKPFCCYHDAEFREEADIEVCVPVTKAVAGEEVTTQRLPAIKAVCTTHIGRYDQLNLTYKALFDFAQVHHLQFLTPSREVYIKGPGMIFRGNENKYSTEIIIPFEEV